MSSTAPTRFIASLAGVTLALGSTGCFGVESPIDDSGRMRARAMHRAASACEGLAPELVERTLEDAPHLLLAAEPITDFGGQPRRLRTIGLRLRVHNDLGLDAPLAERVLSCQSARYAINERGFSARDPLAVEGMDLRVKRADHAIELVLRARDPRDAEEATRRASALLEDREL